MNTDKEPHFSQELAETKLEVKTYSEHVIIFRVKLKNVKTDETFGIILMFDRLDGGCPDGVSCDYAHSPEELQEWTERRDFLRQKLAKAREDMLIMPDEFDFGKYNFLLQDWEYFFDFVSHFRNCQTSMSKPKSAGNVIKLAVCTICQKITCICIPKHAKYCLLSIGKYFNFF